MLETLLKYLSLISIAGAGVSFVVGLVKYLDQRRLEQQTKRFTLFHELMRRIAAQGEKPDQAITRSEQAAAIYELQHFPEYGYASIPILTDLREHFTQGEAAPTLLLQAVDETLEYLKSSPRSKRSI